MTAPVSPAVPFPSPADAPVPPSCWVITDGKAGMENQCVGLAEAVGCVPVIKRIRLRGPWRQLSPYLPLSLERGLESGSDALAAPWPDLLVTSGRQAVGAALAIRRRSGGRTFCVHIQNPGVPFSRFDLVAIPRHDGKSGPNVLSTIGALHRVTPERLAADAALFAPRLAHLPHPRVAVLIGGSNGVYTMTEAVTRTLADRLARLARDGVSLMITASRRTGAANEAVLRERLTDGDPGSDSVAGGRVEMWDGRGTNPYFAYLGLADAIICTCDSVSMVSEAISTGKPVHVIMLDGGSPKFDRFLADMAADGYTRPFDGRLESWHYTPPDDTARVAADVRRRMTARRR